MAPWAGWLSLPLNPSHRFRRRLTIWPVAALALMRCVGCWDASYPWVRMIAIPIGKIFLYTWFDRWIFGSRRLAGGRKKARAERAQEDVWNSNKNR